MGYRLNRLDEPVFIAVPKPMLTEFGIHHRLERCSYITLQTFLAEKIFGNLIHQEYLPLASAFLLRRPTPPPPPAVTDSKGVPPATAVGVTNSFLLFSYTTLESMTNAKLSQ